MGQVQAAAWRASYADLLPTDVVAALEPEALGETWREALVRPQSGSHRVLVALSGGELVGFVAIGPAGGGQPVVGEVVALVVTPGAQRAGHGSRLLNAAADRLREVGFEQVVVWALDVDRVRVDFLTGAGFQPDGATRTFAAGEGEGEGQLREVRLVASLAPPT
jgi:GNAT superfamily N-acetyltransferase